MHPLRREYNALLHIIEGYGSNLPDVRTFGLREDDVLGTLETLHVLREIVEERVRRTLPIPDGFRARELLRRIWDYAAPYVAKGSRMLEDSERAVSMVCDPEETVRELAGLAEAMGAPVIETVGYWANQLRQSADHWPRLAEVLAEFKTLEKLISQDTSDAAGGTVK